MLPRDGVIRRQVFFPCIIGCIYPPEPKGGRDEIDDMTENIVRDKKRKQEQSGALMSDFQLRKT